MIRCFRSLATVLCVALTGPAFAQPGSEFDLSPHIDIGVVPGTGQIAFGFDDIDPNPVIVIDTFNEFLPGGGSGYINIAFDALEDIAFRTASTTKAAEFGFQTFSDFGQAHPQVAVEAVSLDPLFEAFAFGQDSLDDPGDQLVLNVAGQGLDFHPTYILRTNTQDFVGRAEGTFQIVPLTQTGVFSASESFDLTFVVGGDYDDDQRLTTNDVDLLFAARPPAPVDDAFDLDGDGDVDEDDVAFWVRDLAATEFGDLNLDGQVDGNDFGIFAGNFGLGAGATYGQGDLNGDGTIDGNDFGIFAGNFGFGVTSAATPVPEPAGVLTLVVALGAVLRRPSVRS